MYRLLDIRRSPMSTFVPRGCRAESRVQLLDPVIQRVIRCAGYRPENTVSVIYSTDSISVTGAGG